MKNMMLEQVARVQQAAVGAVDEQDVLNVMLVYDDEATRNWARETGEKISKLAGAGAVRSTWWRVAELGQPGVLAGAVSKGMRADVIVVAVRAALLLPLPFYVWAQACMPHRFRPAGLLVALVATTIGSNGCCQETTRYLRAVARRGNLDFLPEQRNFSAPAPRPCRTRTPAQLLALLLPNHRRQQLDSFSARLWRMQEEAA